ncbi:MAG TPA: DUF1326 domain-containing protein [Gemmatimonadales bacterium]
MAWWVRGLLFENCNCQIVCPGHVHFDQLCTHERCLGYWGIAMHEGRFGDVDLAGRAAVVAYDSPQHMIDGGWTQRLIIDESATPAQRDAVEAILNGDAGGPWAVLARFVGRRVETRYLPIQIVDDAKSKALRIGGVVEASLEALRGRDRAGVVTFENMFNQIHAPSQVIARGSTAYDDGEIRVTTQGTHGLYSQFEWTVTDA